MPRKIKKRETGEMTVREAGRLGGEARARQEGSEGMARLGRKGGRSRNKKNK